MTGANPTDMSGTRYRGAQPFGDDYLSQRTFFGRDEDATSLTDQVLANRLMVVYAKSGVGKSSLLNAGVAPRLRDAGYQPLLVRVNDIKLGPRESLRNGVRSEAIRQGIEYVDGDPASLWAFFKTVEFWRGDVLLTPVLILDQFEEVFTLHQEAEREAFLSELGQLTRGVPLAEQSADGALSDAPPPLHMVFSLREDYLGMLEDASDRIPQIMDHRFRLAPLTRQSAKQAMARPAQLNEAMIATAPFTLAVEFTDVVLDYLSQRAHRGVCAAGRYVEPFHLQLICQRIEEIVAHKPGTFGGDRLFTLADFGGEAALGRTLKTFYLKAIGSLSQRRMRPVAKRLCEQFLISPEGRRLSLDEYEMRSQLRLSDQALQQLVQSRLLRTDHRSDRTYYELGHDALIEPILATRRTQALMISWTSILVGSMAIAFIVCFLSYLVQQSFRKPKDDVRSTVLVAILLLGFLALPLRLFGNGVRARRRFRRRGASDSNFAPQPPVSPLVCLAAYASIAGGSLMMLNMALSEVLLGGVVIGLFPADALPSANSPLALFQSYAHRPVQDAVWMAAQFMAALLFGRQMLHWGLRLLRMGTTAEPLFDARGRPRLLSTLTMHVRSVSRVVTLSVAIAGAYLIQRCAGSGLGTLPRWAWPALMTSDAHLACTRMYEGRWTTNDSWLLLFVISLLALSLPSLTGVGRRLWQRRSVLGLAHPRSS